MPVALNASCALGSSPENASHRWDLDSDGVWDTSWIVTEEYEHIWGDDFTGSARVERGLPKDVVDIVLEGELHEVGALNPTQWIAQAFVPNRPLLTKVAVDVSVNWGQPSDLHAWIRDTLDPSGSNLSHGSLPYTEVPRGRYIEPDEWPIIDVEDVVLELNRMYYIMLNLFYPTNGSYEGHGNGLLVPEWPTYGGNLDSGWTGPDDDDNLGFRTYTREITPVAQGEIDVEIQNINPVISDSSYQIDDASASILFRIAGEKWHNVEVHIFESDDEIGYANITRYPGSPNNQTVRLANVSIDPSKKYSATAYYTPEDDPINGQIWGATPAWFVFEFDNTSRRIHHTFNVRHEETWVWNIEDLNQYLPLPTVTLEAIAYDPGSDDLKFKWSFGDGTFDEHIYYNNGMNPDPYPSPDVNPVIVTDLTLHGYSSAGTYTIILTVTDDDNGEVAVSMVLSV